MGRIGADDRVRIDGTDIGSCVDLERSAVEIDVVSFIVLIGLSPNAFRCARDAGTE